MLLSACLHRRLESNRVTFEVCLYLGAAAALLTRLTDPQPSCCFPLLPPILCHLISLSYRLSSQKEGCLSCLTTEIPTPKGVRVSTLSSRHCACQTQLHFRSLKASNPQSSRRLGVLLSLFPYYSLRTFVAELPTLTSAKRQPPSLDESNEGRLNQVSLRSYC